MGTTRAGGIAIAVLAVGLALSGCGSDKKTDSSVVEGAAARRAHPAPRRPPRPGGNQPDDRRLHQAEQHHRDAGQARRPGYADDRPAGPDGWEGDDGDERRTGAYGAIVYTDPDRRREPRPTIVGDHVEAVGQRRPGDDPRVRARRAEEPARVRRRRRREGKNSAGSTRSQIGATYVKDGAKRLVAQKTVVIPGSRTDCSSCSSTPGTRGQTDALQAAWTPSTRRPPSRRARSPVWVTLHGKEIPCRDFGQNRGVAP